MIMKKIKGTFFRVKITLIIHQFVTQAGGLCMLLEALKTAKIGHCWIHVCQVYTHKRCMIAY